MLRRKVVYCGSIPGDLMTRPHLLISVLSNVSSASWICTLGLDRRHAEFGEAADQGGILQGRLQAEKSIFDFLLTPARRLAIIRAWVRFSSSCPGAPGKVRAA